MSATASSGIRYGDQAVEPAFRFAGIHRLGCERDARFQILGATGDDQARGRVEERDVAKRAFSALEHFEQRFRVLLRITAAQAFRLGARETDIVRADLENA